MITKNQFAGLSRENLLTIEPTELGRGMTQDELERIFKVCDAFWVHPEKSEAPHVILTSGKHSNIYINCPLVLCHSNLSQVMAFQMLNVLMSAYHGKIDWVIGSDSSALGISKDLANMLQVKWHPMQKGPNKSQVWEKMAIDPGDKVLHVEELVTTSFTTTEVRKGIRRGNPCPVNFIPFIPVLVYRPDESTERAVDGSIFLPVLHYKSAWTIDPKKEECPLCAQGSEALLAKENWSRLIETM